MKTHPRITALIIAIGLISAITACTRNNGIRQQDRQAIDPGSPSEVGEDLGKVPATVSPKTSTAKNNSTSKAVTSPALTVPLDVVPSVTTPAVTPKYLPPKQESPRPNLSNHGKTFTVVGFSNTDVPGLLNAYLGNPVSSDFEGNAKILKQNNLTASGVQVEYYNTGVAGEDYLTVLMQKKNNGMDIDCFIVEEPQFLDIITSNKEMVRPLSDLGFAEEDFANEYKWVGDIGRDFDGTRYAVSWQASPGIFVYSAAIASNYLGVKTPQQMQALISDFDKFTAAAQLIKEKTTGVYGLNGEGMAIADSIAGLYYPFQQSSLNYRWNTTGGNKLTTDTLNYKPLTDFLSYSKMFFDKGYLPNNGFSSPVGDAWSEDWWRFGRQERVFGYFTGSWGIHESVLGTLANDPTDMFPIEAGRDVDTRLVWRVCQGPQAHSRGGFWLMINSDTDNPYEAKDFIYSSTINPTSMYTYSMQTADFPNSKAVVQQIRNNPSDVISQFDILSMEFLGGQDYFNVLADICENIETYQSVNFEGKSYKFRSQHDTALDTALIDTAIRNSHPTALMTAPSYTDEQNIAYFLEKSGIGNN